MAGLAGCAQLHVINLRGWWVGLPLPPVSSNDFLRWRGPGKPVIVLSTKCEEPWFTISVELKRALLAMGFDVYNPSTDCLEVYQEEHSRNSWTDIWLLTFAEQLDRAEATHGFIVQIQQLDSDFREKSYMQRAEEKLGKRWGIPTIGLPVWPYWPLYRTDLGLPSRLVAALADNAWACGITDTLIVCKGFYEGGVDGACKHGHGKETYAGGQVFEGEFLHGTRNGHGKEVFPNGDVFEGEFQGGKRHGHGKHIHSDGTVLEGEYRDNKLNGHDKELSSNSKLFQGEYREAKEHGHSKNVHLDGTVFGGECHDKLDCHIKDLFQNGELFKGEYRDGDRRGHSKNVQLEASVLWGKCHDDELKRHIKRVFPNGEVFAVEYRDGKRHGH